MYGFIRKTFCIKPAKCWMSHCCRFSINGKKDVIHKIGLLDENFFMYHEEMDWCIRARKAGYRTVCATKFAAWHKVPEDETIKDYLPYKAYFFHRNFFLIAGKHCKNIKTAFKFLFKHLVYYGGHGFPCYFVIYALRKRKIGALKAYLKAYLDGIIFFLKFRIRRASPSKIIVGAYNGT